MPGSVNIAATLSPDSVKVRRECVFPVPVPPRSNTFGPGILMSLISVYPFVVVLKAYGTVVCLGIVFQSFNFLSLDYYCAEF